MIASGLCSIISEKPAVAEKRAKFLQIQLPPKTYTEKLCPCRDWSFGGRPAAARPAEMTPPKLRPPCNGTLSTPQASLLLSNRKVVSLTAKIVALRHCNTFFL
jgi:hypothetical protein